MTLMAIATSQAAGSQLSRVQSIPNRSPNPIPAPAPDASDRLLALAIGVSLAAHLLLILVLVATGGWHGFFHPVKATKLIYEPAASYQQAIDTPVSRVRVQLRKLPAPSASSMNALAGDRGAGAIGLRMRGGLASLGVGRGFGMEGSSTVPTVRGDWGGAIDLTNVGLASAGNPILHSYLDALREHIQRTANEQVWLPAGAGSTGVAYVGFILNQTGTIESAGILPGRSSAPPALQGVAVQIVNAAGPFLPFPPSFTDSSKAVIVPIEFAIGVE